MKSSRLINVDLIRVCAMLLVIVLHTLFNFTLRPDFFGTKVWFLFEPLIVLAKTSTLLFFMLSGYLMCDKQQTIKMNLQRIWRVIVVPFCCFFLIDLAYQFHTAQNTGIGLINFWSLQLAKFVTFPSTSLWFLIVLFFLYALNPIWYLVFAKERRPDLARFFTGTAFIYLVILTVFKIPFFHLDPSSSILTGWLGFVGFYFYGGLVKKTWINFTQTSFNRYLILIGFVVAFACDYLGKNNNSLLSVLSTLPITLLAIGMFNLLISLKLNQPKPRLALLADLAFGIYLIHPFVAAILPELGWTFDHLKINIYLFNLVNYAIVFSISALLTYTITKVPKLRAIIGLK